MYHLPFEPRPSSWLLCHYFKVEMLGRVIVRVLLAQRALLRVYGVLLAVAVVVPAAMGSPRKATLEALH